MQYGGGGGGLRRAAPGGAGPRSAVNIRALLAHYAQQMNQPKYFPEDDMPAQGAHPAAQMERPVADDPRTAQPGAAQPDLKGMPITPQPIDLNIPSDLSGYGGPIDQLSDEYQQGPQQRIAVRGGGDLRQRLLSLTQTPKAAPDLRGALQRYLQQQSQRHALASPGQPRRPILPPRRQAHQQPY